MSLLNVVQLLERINVDTHAFRVDWVSESSIGFSFGSQGKIPARIAGPLNISAFCSTGEVIVAYPCMPGGFCQITCILPADDFDQLGGLRLLKPLMEKLNIPESAGFFVTIMDRVGYRAIEARLGVTF